EAKVLKIEGNKVILDQTCFYPRGGGQPSDTGEIEGIKVLETLKQGEEIIHVLEKEPWFKVNDLVKGKIDWERRYKLMRMHTAAHIISAVINRETKALITGNQLDLEKSRIDYSLETFDRALIEDCIRKANEIAAQGLEVKTYFLKREEVEKIPSITKLAKGLPNLQEFRIVEIVGLDLQADGGTHVKNTKEVGKIKIEGLENKGKDNRRIYFSLEL
ncbi:MAG: alanyl-tRNA editing protein, partial [Candidatus Aenigmarchaeota archaeon]|nr:alanyl-tRNA editing protein [Candidatus Aenigmarchaeota archaeon]